MSSAASRFRALLDAGIPDSIGRILGDRGHEAILHRHILPEKTPDAVVARTAIESAAILIAMDRDMKRLAQRYGVTDGQGRFSDLDLIWICCGNEVVAPKRFRQALTLIEHEWEFCRRKKARRMWVDIGAHFLRTHK